MGTSSSLAIVQPWATSKPAAGEDILLLATQDDRKIDVVAVEILIVLSGKLRVLGKKPMLNLGNLRVGSKNLRPQSIREQ